ncbi:PIN domain nuclease of toxin-antitoxin system [Pararhizobium capsulatum DSM 1112]|uniref:PIN domain nuclease of toxin-antitoxin system n=1 Tax=Pararhizobium capsulatum DSM 1112 TaxID=1121113 RepID=A0ABU0BRV0_9HYPH|nr:type II toxin-antitoxin system VapC family toxin [Pararhizobium capsulatum]MDQ0320981.1 PIN domain nuclease of toxin-antitoxin system [Pararhizobium capsulatum DSM 1112]
MTMTTRYLFDTCLILYLARREALTSKAEQVLTEASNQQDTLFLSAFSAWEIGMLVSKGRLSLTQAPLPWFRSFASEHELSVLEATPDILVASSFLPQPLHADPADRILIATAREHDLTVITRDRAILAYGAAGHVKVLAC